ncbi:oocyte zinc finger protein XlCOF6-like [Euwallacea similis]|uniref:oocyte zinc finger protein XlCOF6-like n=1 Tax=Euwallacea similis TaxID=1736056 RepID=UPI003450453E
MLNVQITSKVNMDLSEISDPAQKLEKHEVLSSSCFDAICRTCLIYGDLFAITETHWDGVSLEDAIGSISLQLEIKANLPNKMCKDCIKMLYGIYNFIQMCKDSEKNLNLILLSETSENNCVKSESHCDIYKNAELNEIKSDSPKAELDYNAEIKGEEGQIKEDRLQSVGTDSDIDGLTPIESKVSSDEENKCQPVEKKGYLSKIKVKNKARLKRIAKAQLVNVTSGARGRKKRDYVFRKGPPYKCITCDSSFQRHEDLKQHKQITKHKKSLKYKCEYCERKYDTNCKYEEHVRTHTGEKPNECSTCGKCFNFKTDLKRHMVMHMEVKPYLCRFCNKGFARKQYLMDHERKHTGEQLLCPFCGKGFHSYSTLTYHEKNHKGPDGLLKNLAKDRLFKCSMCDKTLLTEHTLKAHILLHGPKNFSCEICGKTYISNNRLQDHMKLTHQGIKFTCHLCNKEYKQKSGLEVHIKSHSGQNNYPCDECGKQFASKGSLYQHKRVHTGDTKYQCKECLHICINRRHLENHLRTHTGEKPFSCMFCGKLFAQKANMQAHIKIHTGEKNHVCKLCGKAFYDRRGLKKHMDVHEKNGECEDGC